MVQLFVGQHVRTQYGAGVVKDVRYNDSDKLLSSIVINPLHWKMANDQLPTFYMNYRDVTPLYPIGCVVKTSFGQGIVIKIRVDGIYVIHLQNWVLANNGVPTLYLNQESIAPVLIEPVQTNTQDIVESRKVSVFDDIIERAKEIKVSTIHALLLGDLLPR